MARQVDVEAGTAVDLGRIVDPAMVLLDDAEDHRQSQAGPFAGPFGGEEWLEDSGANLFGDALARVADGQADEISRPGFDVLASAFGIDDNVSCLQEKPATGGHGIAGVQTEIEEHLVDLGGIRLDEPEIGRSAYLECNPWVDGPAKDAHGLF